MKFSSAKTMIFFALSLSLSLAFVTALDVAKASQSEVEPSVNQGEKIEDSITPQQTCTSPPYC